MGKGEQKKQAMRGHCVVALVAIQVAVFVMVTMAPAEAMPVEVPVVQPVLEDTPIRDNGRQLLATAGKVHCKGLDSCNSKAKKLTTEATDFAQKYKKCDEINAKLAKQMAANAKLKELAAARKIRMEKLAKYAARDRANELKTKMKTATVPGAKKKLASAKNAAKAAKKKADELAKVAHKIAGDPKNLKKMGKIQAASSKAAAAHSKLFVSQLKVSKARAHLLHAKNLVAEAKKARAIMNRNGGKEKGGGEGSEG